MKNQTRTRAAGFTLVEALVAMTILSVGLVAISNLFIVATSSNQRGNLTTVTASSASQVMERLKAIRFTSLTLGGDLDADLEDVIAAGLSCAATATSPAPDPLIGVFACTDTIPGVGAVVTRWTIEDTSAGGTDTYFITVRSQVAGFLGRGTRSEFATFRTCTSNGCVY